MANGEPKTGSKSTTKKKTTRRSTKRTAKSPGSSAGRKTTKKKTAGGSRSRTKTPPSPPATARGDVTGDTAPNLSTGITRAELHAMIAEAAYFKAERRGFRDGDPERDWREAEAEIEARFAGANAK